MKNGMIALAVVVSAAGVLAGAASAEKPIGLEKNNAYVREVPHTATCTPLGYGFKVSYRYEVRRTITEIGTQRQIDSVFIQSCHRIINFMICSSRERDLLSAQAAS